ncbi:hypothetical protein PhaeoP88_02415 [Phaeobacter inhibens]|uniref:Uncharacterized protein n=1 Tax=Phaeobacter inhibens TaxID=221822 RepID=A0A2I7KB89_9RHOB|nr:hypothetical protein PhaeoP88_02415 [Phaeobacter inhibens]
MPNDSTDTPDIAQKSSFLVEVREEKTHSWYAYGNSSR